MHGVAPNPDMNDDISSTKHDLTDWLAAIEQVGSVVTDRLHVAVAAVLLGKRLFYLDPYNKKISTYFAYTFRDSFNEVITNCSLEWLTEKNYLISVEGSA
jgi:exopolysaccharide biosynthesis predicted pyruvyltransferase EpsI